MDIQYKEMRGVRSAGSHEAGYPVRMPGFSSPSRNPTPASLFVCGFDDRSWRGAVELTTTSSGDYTDIAAGELKAREQTEKTEGTWQQKVRGRGVRGARSS